MNWIYLQSEEQLDKLISRSGDHKIKGILFFKHSTRCAISSMAKNRLESAWDFSENELPAYYLDILSHRSLSDKVAEVFGVRHESPQVLLIKSGSCVYHGSHLSVSLSNIKKQFPEIV